MKNGQWLRVNGFTIPPEPGAPVVVVAIFWPSKHTVPGTVAERCHWCGTAVCKAPDTQTMIDGRAGAPVLFCCLSCFIADRPEQEMSVQ